MKQALEVRHACGCRRRYELDVAGELLDRMREQLAAKACGLATCPQAATGRLTAARAAANGTTDDGREPR